MAQNLTQPTPYEDEIDLREIFKILIESKKLIIVTILIFTITSIIYSLSLNPEFKSSTILEIGYYEMPDGTQKSIEEPSDLISNLNLFQFRNSKDNNQITSFDVIENKLILFETRSRSVEENENLLTEMIKYTDERHSNLSLLRNKKRKEEISFEIEMIKSEISFIKASKQDFEDKIAELKNTLPLIDKEINQLDKVIIDDTNNLSLLKEANKLTESASNSPTLDQIILSYSSKINDLNLSKYSMTLELNSLNKELKLLENDIFQSNQLFDLEQEKAILENELQVLMSQTHVNTSLIRKIETDTIKQKTPLIISLGIIFGFFASIVLVFTNNFIKEFRESKA